MDWCVERGALASGELWSSCWPQNHCYKMVSPFGNYSPRDEVRLKISWKQSEMIMATVVTGAREWKGEGRKRTGLGWKWERKREERERESVCVQELAAWCQWAWELRGTSGPSLAPRGSVWWLTHAHGRTYVHGYTLTPTTKCGAIHSLWPRPLSNLPFNAWLQQTSIWAAYLQFGFWFFFFCKMFPWNLQM